ncbi:MAG: restriction endonuclease subunit R [Candidatus Acididesulfobacter diazotrophicus]|uniref:Restriction endonuclease subunit R n=1 Tax=Candidatus Acididesulfobacter diazotrophicus TaxID=2597226 RepID=A0A519BKW1_9DELT|nr:MAG: restriction endonuclease subunit R [Candidatus Acididesulfobacter diazotrophicus]
MILKDFQKTAIDQLSLTFLDLWKTGKYKIPLVFKSPTGSGKTIMMAEFLRCLDDNYLFHEDKAYIWVSFGGDESYSQSKDKLYRYYNDGTDMHLKDYNNLSEGKLYKNNILFINWSKIKGTDKESRKLRKSGGVGYGGEAVFDEFIQNTRKERDIVLIIDEAHTETDTTLANEVIDLINPRIIIKITATPKNIPNASEINQKKAGFVEVLESEVITSGLIKEEIIIQTDEDIKKLEHKEFSEDEIMLKLAYDKRLELKKLYEKLGLDINPLVMIQLPSDFKEKEDVQINKKDIVLSYLREKGAKEKEIAVWLSNEKKNLELIEKNDSEVNFMIFKVAPATGWDCPRAEILVMFREITSPTFHTQIIGRIKRMPEGHRYNKEELNKAYIYTNYNKDHIRNIKDPENKHKIPIYFTELKKDIEIITLETTYYHRTDFNTLTPPPLWQRLFLETMDIEFGTSKEIFTEIENYNKVKSLINLENRNVNNRIIVNAKIESFDNFIDEIKEKATNMNYHFSNLDVERLYNLLCFEELNKQEDEEAKYNPSRSWSQLKSALNVWFNTRLGLDRDIYYPIIVNELSGDNIKIKTSINKALKDFRKKYEIEIKEKEEKEVFDLELPEREIGFTEDYEKIEGINKNIYKEFYNRKQYLGKDNEERFVKFLESQENIIWWHKQDDSGRKVFAIEYFDTQEKKNRLFYTDFIIKTINKIYLLDTKSGNTAKSQETADKNKALQKWIKEKKSKYVFEIIGGIIIEKYPHWKINKKENYVYENESDWEILEF